MEAFECAEGAYSAGRAAGEGLKILFRRAFWTRNPNGESGSNPPQNDKMKKASSGCKLEELGRMEESLTVFSLIYSNFLFGKAEIAQFEPNEKLQFSFH